MDNDKKGIILDSKIPFVSEVNSVYVLALLGGIIGGSISFFNGNSIFAVIIAFLFAYLIAFVAADITVGSFKYLALQMKDYALPGGAISPKELYDLIYPNLVKYGKLKLVNRNLTFVQGGLEYHINIDYDKDIFSISISSTLTSFSPANDLRTCRYNKAIIIIPIIVYAIQQAALEINSKQAL